MVISPAGAIGWSITPSGTVPDCWSGATITEGAANFLGEPPDEQIAADALVATRGRSSAPDSLRGLNGRLGSGFGQRFQPANDPRSQAAIAA